jgi:tyrosyl-tRNA synthetase
MGIEEAIRENNKGRHDAHLKALDALNEIKPVIPEVFGLTAPLVKKADGTKFGKTEAGAIWLTAARTSPYAYHQFWLNASDDDARDWIKIFTFLPKDEIDAILARHADNPGARELQRALADEATKILHGEAQRDNAIAAGKALFSGDIATLDEPTLLDVFANIESSAHAISDLDQGIDPVELLKSTGLATSNREAREFLGNGSVSVNGTKIDPDTTITRDHLLHGSIIAIRRGKKNWRLTRWS